MVVEGTGGGFSHFGNDESAIAESEAQGFFTPNDEEMDNISRISSNSRHYSDLRASFPSQSGATKMPFASILKPTKTPTKSLLGRYNDNLAKHSARAVSSLSNNTANERSQQR